MDRISQHPDSHDIDISDNKIKKDKKWSLGGLFRRRKKDDSDSSSQEDPDSSKKGTFLSRRKSKSNDSKRKRSSKLIGTFDHVVISPVMKHKTVFTKENEQKTEENTIDPSAGFVGYVGRGLPPLEQNSYLSVSADKLPRSSRESLAQKSNVDSISRASYGSGSLESASRKYRRERAKARAEAKRNIKNDSSSDEGSQKSNASSLSRFRSDDSLANSYKEGSLSRKSRSARTERYMKRLSKDDEVYAQIETHPVIKTEKQEIEQQYGRWTSSVYKSPNSPDYKTEPKHAVSSLSPVHNSKPKIIQTSSLPLQTSASLTSMSSYTPSQSSNKYQSATEIQSQIRQIQKPPVSSNSFSNYTKPVDYINQRNDLYSAYDSNANNKRISHNNNMIIRHRSLNSTPQNDDGDVMVVQFPISKPQAFKGMTTTIAGQFKCPPPPPPRDPQRKYITNSQLENPRHSYAFENGTHHTTSLSGPLERGTRVHSFNRYASPQNVPVNRSTSFGQSNNIYWNNRCNSDDHIALTERYQQQNISYNSAVPPRPSSVTAEAMRPQIKRYITRHPPESSMKAEPQVPHYKYFADHTPRSRKPIQITAASTRPENVYLSDSQVKNNDYATSPTPQQHQLSKTASDFWKQKDQEEAIRKSKIYYANNLRIRETNDIIKPKAVKQSPTLLTVKNNSDTCSVSSRSSVSSPYQLKQDSTDDQRLSMVIEKSKNNTPQKVSSKPAVAVSREPPLPPQRRSSRHSSGSSNDPMDWLDNGRETADVTKKRKSSNLEEALSELEAIYKSLRLGDEDLLDGAELRDIPTPNFNNQNKSQGNQSDSGYNYTKELDINQSVLRQNRLKRRSEVPDKVADDMAYRRLNPKDRPQSQDVHSTMSQISYLLSSPLAGNPVDSNFNYQDEVDANQEPDITLDDVVYRQIKDANNTLKVKDPQPPFGIPLGPLAPASNSDYLHAQPENKSRPRFIPQKSPDIVTDDLAYRNLRKDQKKDSPLPPVRPEEVTVFFSNNNHIDLKPIKFGESIKRRRAVRSLSENIYNLIQRQVDKYPEDDKDLEKSLCLSDETDTTKIKSEVISKPTRRSSYTAYSVLSDTELPKLRVSTRNLASYSPTSTETLTDSRNNLADNKSNGFQQRLRVFVPNEEQTSKTVTRPMPPKPPVKPSTPKQVSPSPTKSETDSKTEDDFLTALAREAEATSEQIDLELKELRSECMSPSKTNLTPRSSEQPIEKVSTTENDTKDNKDQIDKIIAKSTTPIKSPVIEVKASSKLIQDIDSVSEQAKLCKKLLECVVEGHQSSVPETIELTAAIDSDQTTEFSEVEEIEPVLGGSSSPMIFTSVASLMLMNKSPKASSEAKSVSSDNFDHEGAQIAALKDKCQLHLGELENLSIEPDYDNVANNCLKISELYCDSGIEVSPNTQTVPPESETKKQKCLNKLISDEIKLSSTPAGTSSDSINTMAAHIQNDLLTIEELLKTQVEPTVQEDSSEYNSAEELAAIFNNSDEGNEKYVFEEATLDDLNTKSDLNTDTKSTNDKIKIPSSSTKRLEPNIGENLTSYIVVNKLDKSSRMSTSKQDDLKMPPPDLKYDSLNNQRGHPEGSRSTQGGNNLSDLRDKQGVILRPWYRDHRQILMACSYCLACTHQLAGLDLLTVLGILLAMISVIAMLLI